MTFRRLTTLVSAALLTTWLVSAAVSNRDDEAAPPQAQAANATRPAVDNLDLQAARLRARIEVAPVPRRSSRNPFRFGQRTDTGNPAAAVPHSSPVRAPMPTSAAPSDVQVPATPPTLRLVAIAMAGEAEGEERTAAISVAGELVLVHVGADVAGRYRVSAISPDVVELHDRLDGTPLRLALR